MAIGKSRNSKRGSLSTSYTSTLTTVVFVALCVVGVWMLTSNSVVPLQTTTTARTNVNNDGDRFSSSSNDQSQITKSNSAFSSSNEQQNHIIKQVETKKDDDQPAFEDNPGDLPDDAIKSEQLSKSQQSEDHHHQKEREGSASAVVEGNSHGLQGTESAQEKEKQTESQTQIAEESTTMTQNQQEEAQFNTQKSNDVDKGTESSELESQNQKSNETPIEKEYEKEQRQQREEDSGNLTKSTQDESQNVISDEDQQNRIKQQHQQQQEQLLLNPPSATGNTNSGSGVTFSDETRKDHPPENGLFKEVTETELPQHSSNNETKQQERESEQKKNISSMIQEAKQGTTNSGESFLDGGNSGIPKESAKSKKSWKTQAAQSKNEKERQKDGSDGKGGTEGYTWRLCNVTAGPDYIPCLDNVKALQKLRTTAHFEHRERHCPGPEEAPTCLVPLPENYKSCIEWPKSREKIWYHNVPHTKLAEVKGHQNWVKVTGEFLTFPGGGTQFIHGALHYIDFLQKSVPNIAWGKLTRVILDVGCGVASFGGFLFDRNVIAMSLAPKDEHEAQVQFALERGIPAISAVMGSQRLPFPSRVFDLVHCARCRVPWHNEGGKLLLELNRVLRPGGYFVWSATPVYQKTEEDVQIWKAMSSLTVSICWELVTIQKDKLNGIGAAIYRKPVSNECYEKRKQNQPPMCKSDNDPNASWYVPLQACMHMVPVIPTERGSRWPEDWPQRLQTPPYWLNSSQMGIYGKPAPKDFLTDYEHWKQVVIKVYMSELGISWTKVRNVMDMRAVYGGFAAALKDLQVWVMNVVNIDSPDTLPIIYERGLFGIYHDWCESFSTYPRSYDLLHADHLFSKLKKRCQLVPVMAEVDRIVRPGGKLIVRDESNTIKEVEKLLKSLHWEVHLTFSKDQEGILGAQKGNWRPDT